MRKLERKTFPRNPQQIKKMYDEGKISFDNAVQRNFVWKNTKKDNRMSKLIDTMLRDFPIPPMYCNCVTDSPEHPHKKVYYFIDGKQRNMTVIKFLLNQFKLVNIPTFENEDGTEDDLNGLTFDQLPEDYKLALLTYPLMIYYYDDLYPEEEQEMFNRLNNGKSLTAIELTRVKAKSFETIMAIGEHPIFDEMLTQSGLAGYSNEDIVVKTWIMFNKEKPCLDTKEVRPTLENAEFTQEDIDRINEYLTFMQEVHTWITECTNDKFDSKRIAKIAKNVYTKTHFISFVKTVNKAMKDGKNPQFVAAWLMEFFNTATSNSVDPTYAANCTSGSGHADAVKARLDSLHKSYVVFSKMHPEKKINANWTAEAEKKVEKRLAELRKVDVEDNKDSLEQTSKDEKSETPKQVKELQKESKGKDSAVVETNKLADKYLKKHPKKNDKKSESDKTDNVKLEENKETDVPTTVEEETPTTVETPIDEESPKENENPKDEKETTKENENDSTTTDINNAPTEELSAEMIDNKLDAVKRELKEEAIKDFKIDSEIAASLVSE